MVLVGAELLPDEEFLELLRSVRLRGIPLRVVPGARLDAEPPAVSQSLTSPPRGQLPPPGQQPAGPQAPST